MTHRGSGQGAVRLRAYFWECGFKFGVGDGEVERLPMQALETAWLGELGEDPESGIIRGHLVQPLHCSSENANAQEEVPGSSPHAYYCKSWLPTSPFVPGLRFFKITC